MSIYTHKSWTVAAIQWTGDNLAEVQDFVWRWIGPDDQTDVWIDPDGEGRVLQFHAWGGDQEVDPGRWIIVDLAEGVDTGQVMNPDDFLVSYEPAKGEGR